MSLALPVRPPPPNEDLDAETSGLIAKLVLEDLEEVFAAQKGKSRFDAPLSDEEYAYQLQEQYFRDLLIIAEDEKYARSLEAALETDAAHLEAYRVAEEAAEQDRCAAQMVERGEPLPPQTAVQARLEHPEFSMEPEPLVLSPRASEKRTEKDIYVVNHAQATLCDDHEHDQFFILAGIEKMLQSSNFDSYASGPGPSVDRRKTVICISCSESFGIVDVLHVPCDHYYCSDCIATLVELFTRDESLFPLRCCQESIPPDATIPFITSALRAEFARKHAEYSVLAKDRIYCVEPTCSTFLGSSVGVVGTGVLCPNCPQATCPQCKQAEHGQDDCAANAAILAMVELRALASREGWQTCPGCHNLVELNLGCYHMTCRCRTQFCYLCAVAWKNCQCPQWEENRLIATAQQRVENEMGAQAFRNMEPEALVRQVAQRAEVLRDNHNCDRHQWRYRNGGGMCEECFSTLPSYLFICRNCSILACRRCSRNRL